MKRPQGFDPAPAPPPQPAKPARAARVSPIVSRTPKPEKAQKPEKPISTRPSRRELRAARRERRSYEKGEVRRFTRRPRSRRRVIAAVIALVLVFAGLIAVAVWSPLLALRQIQVVGASRIDPAAITDALDGQLGTPLALLDLDLMTQQLAEFPLIRSYTTQSVPPNTLVVTIVEREPVGLVVDGSSFAVVDPAGVVIDSAVERPAGLPLISAGDASIGNPAFVSAIEVLLALPPELLARVETITASTKDDVSFVLAGGVQSVTWGSADRSAFKARVLATLVATQPESAGVEYDLSAPDAPVVRSR